MDALEAAFGEVMFFGGNHEKLISRRYEYSDSTVLITGGSGSIGMELARTLLHMNIRQVRIFSNDENGLFEARVSLGKGPKVTYILGDVTSKDRTRKVMDGCDIVLHAAGLKHVHFCEENPYAAITTNVVGTKNMIDLALERGVSRFVYISTDKAVNPASAMGATKLLGEKLVTDAAKTSEETVFACVRFGNVLGSRGSVVRIFERQVRKNEVVTVTDPEMTRFIMLPTEAAGLVLEAGQAARSGEIFIFKMRAAKIGVLAEACVEFFAGLYHKHPKRIRVEVVGRNPGEKIHEELMTPSEAPRASARGELFYVIPPVSETSLRDHARVDRAYSSDSVPLLSKSEILYLLSELYATSHVKSPDIFQVH